MTLRTEKLERLRVSYDALLDKDSPIALSKIGWAVAEAKQAGASDRECMDSIRSRDWSRYKRYKDHAREKGWL